MYKNMTCSRRCLICYSEKIVTSGQLLNSSQDNDDEGILSLSPVVASASEAGSEECSVIPVQPAILCNQTMGQMLTNLDTIFILRNVLEVPQDEIVKHLKRWGGPSSWIRLCERCNEAVTNAKSIYQEILDATTIFGAVKKEIIEVVKRSLARSRLNEDGSSRKADHCNIITVDKDNGIMEITDKSRSFVEKHKYGPLTDPFVRGDLEARKLIQTWQNEVEVIQNSKVDEAEKYDGTDNVVKDDDKVPKPLSENNDMILRNKEGDTKSILKTQEHQINVEETTQTEDTAHNMDRKQNNRLYVKNREESASIVFEEQSFMPLPAKVPKYEEFSTSDSHLQVDHTPCNPENIFRKGVNSHNHSTTVDEGIREKVMSNSFIANPIDSSINNTDDNTKEDSPQLAVSQQEKELLGDLKTESALQSEKPLPDDSNETATIITPHTNKVKNVEHTVQSVLLPTEEEKDLVIQQSVTARQEEEKNTKSKSTVLKSVNSIQLNFNIPRFPVIKQTSKEVAEEKSEVKTTDVSTFTIPKFPIITNRTPTVEKPLQTVNGVCSEGPKTIQDISSTEEKVSSVQLCHSIPVNSMNRKVFTSKTSSPSPKFNVTSSFSNAPITAAVSNNRINCRSKWSVNNKRPQSKPQQTLSTPLPVLNSGSVDLDPFLEDLLNLPPALKQKRNLPIRPLNNVNEPHGKREQVLAANGTICHLCLCGNSYSTTALLNRHVNQMKRKASLTSSPNSTNGTSVVQKAMKEMSFLKQQLEGRDEPKKQDEIHFANTTTAAANKILQRYSPRKRTNVFHTHTTAYTNNKCNYYNSLLNTGMNNMKELSNCQQFNSVARPVLPQAITKQQLFPNFQKNLMQTLFTAGTHKQPTPISISSYQRSSPSSKLRPSSSQMDVKQQFTSLSHTTATPTQSSPRPLTARGTKKWYHCRQCLNGNVEDGNGGTIKRFWSIAELTNHIHFVHGGWKCTMPKCDRRFSTHAALQSHILKQQCNMEAYATSQAQILKTTPISIPKRCSSKVLKKSVPVPVAPPKYIIGEETKNNDQDIICIELDD